MHITSRLAALALTWALGPGIGTTDDTAPVAIAIHGGAGTLKPELMSPERETQYRATLGQAVQAGHRILATGGSSLEAVRAAINLLEDSPLFNAGKGAVFNADGRNELDASVMDGASLNAGAVAAVHRVRNPIDLAIKVMTDSKHVMLFGEGAEIFAQEHGVTLVDPSYFYTDYRWQSLQDARRRESVGVPRPADFFSTVGAVALDRHGNLAAGTSTGGMTNKRFGRVGDSPIIGAGTYADNSSCAVSATGHGEYFIRWVVAFNICNRVAAGASMQEAADAVIKGVLVEAGGEGGVISMDAGGDIAMSFNSEGMYRAAIGRDGRLFVGIYADE